MKQEKINTNNTLVEDQEFYEEDKNSLTAEDFLSGEGDFIKNPGIGESIEFTLKSVRKQPAKKVKNPKTGKNMDISLSSVDYYFDFISDEDKALTVNSWQVVGKTKAILKKLGGKYGIPLKIEHVLDGMKAPKGADAWKVYTKIDGVWKELDKETNEWK